MSAGVSDLAAPYILQSSKGGVVLGATESAVVGGTVSVLSGGSFANGAVTGAFGYLFNDYAHTWGAAGAVGGAIGGAAIVSGGCDLATAGACVVATPATVMGGAAVGATGGYAIGSAAGGVVDGITVIAQRINANSNNSMMGTELYYLLDKDKNIMKIGVTSYPKSRYSAAWLASEGLEYVTQYYFNWRYAAYLAENLEFLQYQATHFGTSLR